MKRMGAMEEDTMLSLEKCCGPGWYEVERDAHSQWAWSKENAILYFEENKSGVILKMNADIAGYTGKPRTIIITEPEKRYSSRHEIDDSMKTVYIPPGILEISMSVSEVTRPVDASQDTPDERALGICLFEVDKAELRDEYCSSLPLSLEIETTRKCNMNPPCVMCGRMLAGKTFQREMPDAVLQKIQPYVTQAQSVSLHGIGEPLTDPRIFNILELIKDGRTRSSFSTNGLLLDGEAARKLVSLRIREIHVSFDAATEGTYKKLRGGDFTTLRQHVSTLSRIKREMRSSYPLISLSMVLMRENMHEAEGLVELAHEVGAQKVIFQLLNPRDCYFSVKRGSFIFDYGEQLVSSNDSDLKQHLLAAQQKALQRGIELDFSLKELENVIA